MLLAIAPAAFAEESVATTAATPRAADPVDAFQVRLRYGVSVRSGAQQDAANPSLSYSGMTPNDLALSAWGWFLLNAKIGAALAVQREAFALYDGMNRITGGGLVRASIGPAGRLILGPVKLELVVGYHYSQLPSFGSTASPAFKTGNRHAVLLAARGIVDVGPVGIEARGEFPVTVAATDSARGKATAIGWAVGGAVRVQVVRTGSVMWGLLADVTWMADELNGQGGFKSSQSVIRAGGAVDVKWQDAALPATEAARFGGLEVRVTDVDSQAPVVGAAVQVGDRTLTTDAAGLVQVGDLVAGTIAARASVGGYVAEEAQGTIAPGTVARLELKLKKEAPRPGSVVVKVVAREGKKPLANAKVKLGGKAAVTDVKGEVRFDDLAPGPIALTLTADGYAPGEEAASVVAGQTAQVDVTLNEVKKRVPATITGQVRSTAGGKPIAADLEIPQAKIKTKANATGTFTFKVEGGTYTVNIAAPGYLSQSKSVTVKDGDQAIFNVDLHPK